MKLTKIKKITGQIKLMTGLHIGSGETEMHIGGTDNPVIKNPVSMEPYIPGSSIKGKVRSLLEWHVGTVAKTKGKPLGFKHIMQQDKEDQINKEKTILKLFGGAAGSDTNEELLMEVGPVRLSFWDCNLNSDWVKEIRDEKNLLLTEIKMETSIDRITGTAASGSLRNTERVVAGAVFDFQVSIRVHDDEDLLNTLLEGLKLVEITGLGGSVSRGYGKFEFKNLKYGEKEIQSDFDKINFE
jgi:CRISPR-associated protein Csm3